MKLVVKVWDEQIEISIVQKSKSVWVAYCEYMGKRIDVQGRSANTAAAKWRDAAKYRGN